MLELTMYNIRKYFGDNLVLYDAGFKVYEGDKVGMVGSNGSGKSTILKLLAGIEPMDIDYRKICEGKSRISYPAGTTVAYLDQLPAFPAGLRVIDILMLALREFTLIEDELRALEELMGQLAGEALDAVLKKYGRLQQSYDAKGGYEKEEKLGKVCAGLKFDDAFLQKEFNILSGGERTSVMLGKILLEGPDILLLDEPTNHLDMDSAEWLESHLRGYRGIVIVVSHDRYFLDNVATKIIEVENKQCETYEGNYSDYVRQKEENLLLQYENYKEQCKRIDSMEKTIKDLRNWALQADNNKFFRRAVSLQRKLDKMDRISRPQFKRQSIRINFNASDKSGNDVIKVCGLSKSFGDRTILDNADLYAASGERIALIGPNGSGKTTFLKLLLGEAAADSGNAAFGANARIAYLPQIITFKDEEATVIDCFREDRYILEGKAREYLARFMFFGKAPFRKVKQLSGGERVRLKLSMLLYDEINVLILDEPTNHLDIESIEALEEALEDFEGTLLFISHDRYFINKVSGRVIAVEDKKLSSYPGNYDYYKLKKEERSRQREESKSIGNKGAGIKAVGDNAVRDKAVNDNAYGDRDAGENGLRNNTAGGIHQAEAIKTAADLKKLECDMKSLEDEVQKIDVSMSADGIDYDELSKLYCRREELNAELGKMMDVWLSLCDRAAPEGSKYPVGRI